jgi:hypothetical protein
MGFFVCFHSFQPAPGQRLIRQLRELLSASVFIIIETDRSGDKEEVGCGFFVTSNFAATALHVVAPARGQLTGILAGGASFPIFIHRAMASLDLAILRTPHNGKPVPIAVEPENIEPGELVYCANFAIFMSKILQERQAEHSREQQVPTLSLWEGVVCKVTKDFFAVSRGGAAGDSGAAIILSTTGQVVGIYLEGVNEAKERKEHLDVDNANDRLDTLEQSVDSLVQAVHTGGIVLKISQIWNFLRPEEIGDR